MKLVDKFLNAITMYRLVLYYLILLLVVSCIYSFFHILLYPLSSIILSTLVLLFICIITNTIFAKVFDAPTNQESAYITALILALILTPARSISDLPLFVWAGVLSMATKYILAINKKHVFNPAAIAVALTAFAFNGSASWWIGTLPMVPFVLLGILIVKKLRRYNLVWYFFIAAFVTIAICSFGQKIDLLQTAKETITGSPILFFAFVMLTEPLTTPPTKFLQSIYGALVGMLFVPQFHIASWYTTPEIALIIGNIFAYLVSPKIKVFPYLKEKIKTSAQSMDFIFTPQTPVLYLPGQYMEWTLPHQNMDDRGNRRYFTLASSPTEKNIQLGVKFYENSSSYKKALQQIKKETRIVGAQVAGDFTLPKNKKKKLVFIAGGIGITPFRSMVKYLLDTKEKRNIILIYANRVADEILYKDIFSQAEKQINLQIIYTLTDSTNIPENWHGMIGRISDQMIREKIPDYIERTFYISGPNAMVAGCEHILSQIGVKKSNIKKDYFAGF